MAEQQFPVALEIGKKRTFASAIDWPGWARSGRDEASALAALLTYRQRYQRALQSTPLNFHAPSDPAAFVVVERLAGNMTTDYGAPNQAPVADSAPVDAAALERYNQILHASWLALANAVTSASGKQLRTGPRGGGRDTAKILDHVINAHYSYLRKIQWHEPHQRSDSQDVASVIAAIHRADEQALAFATSDQMPAIGPRGGALWKPRYFVRRAAWHILDHAWEIEDRLEL